LTFCPKIVAGRPDANPVVLQPGFDRIPGGSTEQFHGFDRRPLNYKI